MHQDLTEEKVEGRKKRVRVKYRNLTPDQRMRQRKAVRKHYFLNKEACKASSNKTRIKFLKQWGEIIPNETNCQICGTKIFFNNGSQNTAIHFDHKNEGLESISGYPKHWVSSHIMNEKNLKIWNSCGFGMLCGKCNRYLPTKNRKEFLRSVIKYVFGKELDESYI